MYLTFLLFLMYLDMHIDVGIPIFDMFLMSESARFMETDPNGNDVLEYRFL